MEVPARSVEEEVSRERSKEVGAILSKKLSDYHISDNVDNHPFLRS